MTVDVYAISGDFVTCSDCGKVMLLPHGADKCPACRSERTLAWTDDALQETDIDGLVGRHCNLHQKVAPAPEEYLSLSTLATEYIHYLADRPQTARETLSLILEISFLFEKHWQETCCFQSENLYMPAINSLLDKAGPETERGRCDPDRIPELPFPRRILPGGRRRPSGKTGGAVLLGQGGQLLFQRAESHGGAVHGLRLPAEEDSDTHQLQPSGGLLLPLPGPLRPVRHLRKLLLSERHGHDMPALSSRRDRINSGRRWTTLHRLSYCITF